MRRFRLLPLFFLAACAIAACALQAPRIDAGWSPALRPGDSFRDCADCPVMTVLPAGRYTMGSPRNEAGRFRQEGPQRETNIPAGFAIGRTEITRGQWARFVAATGYTPAPGCLVWENGRMSPNPSAGWRNPGFAQTDSHPAVCVSWDDAQAYVRWLSMETGRTYRLAFEEEWEYAARAGAQTSRPWGDDPAGACEFANVADLSALATQPFWVAHACADGHVFTAPVGSLRANRFGLYDLIGNVWEWSASCWGEVLGIPDAKDPDCTQRVIRGGSWLSMPAYARSATRHRLDSQTRFSELGFRVIRLADPR